MEEQIISAVLTKLISASETLCLLRENTDESTAAILTNQIAILIGCQEDLLNLNVNDKIA